MSAQPAAKAQAGQAEYRHITVTPYAAALGAEISGVNLSEKLRPEVCEEIRRAWLANIVVFFRDQELTPQQQHDFLNVFRSTIIQTYGSIYNIFMRREGEGWGKACAKGWGHI